jgi:hypothetical protein
MFEKITSAFNPIITLLQAVSYPIAFVCAAMAILLIMIGQKRKGLEIIKWAVIGYLLMQLLPGLMSILHSVGGAMTR